MRYGKLPAFLTIFAVFLSGCVGQPTAETTTTTTIQATTTTTPSGVTTTTIPTTTTTVSAGKTQEFKIIIDHSGGYSINKISVNKGDTVKILAISNQPPHEHGITIDAYNVNVKVLKNSFADTDVIEFVADTAGEFEMYCKTCETGPLLAHPWIKGTLEVK